MTASLARGAGKTLNGAHRRPTGIDMGTEATRSTVEAHLPVEATDHRRTDASVGIDPLLVRRVLVGVVVLLVLGHLAFVVPQIGLGHVFDLDRESGPGTWVSTTLFTLATATALLLAARVPSGRRRWALIALALVACALGAEEVIGFHESASLELATAADLAGADSGGTPYMGHALLPFLAWGTWMVARRCTRRPKWGLVAGASVWFAATFVTEQLDAWNLAVAPGQLEAALYLHRIITAFQEGGEMLGVTIVIVALLEEIQALGAVRLEVGPRRTRSRSDATWA